MTRRGRIPGLIPLLALLVVTAFAGTAAAVVLHPGDLVVTGGGGAGGNFLAVVDPATGASQMISQGGLLIGPFAVAVGPDGFVYAGNQTTIVRVDPSNGAQTPFATLATNAVRIGAQSTMICTSNGQIFYSGLLGDVVHLDLTTGATSLVSSGALLIAITEGPDGHIYGSSCLSTTGGTCGVGGLTTDVVARRVSLPLGTVTNVGFGPIGKPRGIAFDARDSMFVESLNDRRVFRFHPVTGLCGVLTGPETTYTPFQMVGHPDGNLYLTHAYTEGRVDRLDPVTLVRTSIASFPGNSLVGITVVRDWATPVRRSTWGSLKQLYR